MHRRVLSRKVGIGTALCLFWCVFGTCPFLAAQNRDEFKGRLLVASSRLTDPRFENTVVLIIDHDENGAFGLVVNRPVGTVPLAHLFEDQPMSPTAMDKEIDLYFGGPVQLDAVFLLHTPVAKVESSKEVLNGVFLSMAPETLEKIGQPEGPSRFLLLAGYAGWGAGQLEQECKEGAWFTVDADAALIFSPEPSKTWDRLMEKIVVRF